MNGEAFLRQRDFARRVARDFHDGKAGLLRPGGGDFRHRFAGRFRERIPKIRGRGVRKLVRRDVFPDPVTENIFAKKTLDHANERHSFSVGDVVESAVRFRFGFDRLLDRMRD